jgi:hypothetical protein
MIIYQYARRNAKNLVAEEGAAIKDPVASVQNKVPELCMGLLNTVMADEKSVRVFVRTLLAMDLAEAASGNLDAERPFVQAALRVAYVWFALPKNKPSNRMRLMPPIPPDETHS